MTASDQSAPSTPPAETAPRPARPIASRRGWLQRTWAELGAIRAVWILIAVGTVVLLARGLLTPAAPSSKAPMVVAGHTATPLPAAPLVGHLAPSVTVLDLNGHQVPLSSFRGQVVVLNFWYIACDPCRYEMPLIEKVWHADRGQGLEVIGLNMTDSASDIAYYAHLLGIDYPILTDLNQRAVVGYNVVDTPTTFVIDRQGVIRAKFVGAITDSATLESAVNPLLSAH